MVVATIVMAGATGTIAYYAREGLEVVAPIAENTRLRNEKAELRDELDLARATLAETEAAQDTQKQALEQLETEKTDLVREREKLRTDARDAREERDSARRVLDQTVTANTAAKEELAGVRSDLHSARRARNLYEAGNWTYVVQQFVRKVEAACCSFGSYADGTEPMDVLVARIKLRVVLIMTDSSNITGLDFLSDENLRAEFNLLQPDARSRMEQIISDFVGANSDNLRVELIPQGSTNALEAEALIKEANRIASAQGDFARLLQVLRDLILESGPS